MALPARTETTTDDTPDPEVLATLQHARRHPGRWVMLGVGVVALAAALTWWFWPTQGRDTGWEQQAITRGPLIMSVTAVGQLEPVDSVEIGSDLSGRLESVAVRTNDRVEAGEELARLDPEPFENAVTQARAQVASARAAVAQASANLDSRKLDEGRLVRLFDQGATTGAELDAAQLALKVAVANLASARAQRDLSQAALDRAQDNLRDSVIVSPIDGVVTQRYVDPGQTVVSAMQATPLFEIASDLALMKAEVGVDEADIGAVQAGLPATFTVSAWPVRVFQAKVATVDIAPDPTQAVVTYGADLRIDNADMALRPGMTATAEIQVGRLDDVLQVPAMALRFTPRTLDRPDEPTLWRLVQDKPTAIPVQVLGTDGVSAAVQGEGLVEGMNVLVGGEGR